MSPARVALLAQLASTLPLVGLIWLVQIVSYPLFARVAPSDFPSYHAAHARLITVVVGPLMVVELGASLAGMVYLDRGVTRELAWVGFGLALSTWLVTMFVSVPRHETLSAGFDRRAHELLVATNWLRTIAWTLRGAILLSTVARWGER